MTEMSVCPECLDDRSGDNNYSSHAIHLILEYLKNGMTDLNEIWYIIMYVHA